METSEGRGSSPFHSGRRRTDVHRTSCDPAPLYAFHAGVVVNILWRLEEGQYDVFAVLFVSALMIILAVAIIYMIYRYIRWYKQEIADYISLFVAFSTFAISTTLSEYVKEHLSINLIALNIIIHLVYTGFRHYYRECRKNRGYYYQ